MTCHFYLKKRNLKNFVANLHDETENVIHKEIENKH